MIYNITTDSNKRKHFPNSILLSFMKYWFNIWIKYFNSRPANVDLDSSLKFCFLVFTLRFYRFRFMISTDALVYFISLIKVLKIFLYLNIFLAGQSPFFHYQLFFLFFSSICIWIILTENFFPWVQLVKYFNFFFGSSVISLQNS